MLNSKSVKSRFLISVLSNIARAGINFLSGLLIARGLNPAGYGDFTFLLGSFVAIRSLMDMGSSNAFYTFISQKKRSSRFFLLYFVWLTFQFVATCVLVYFVMPDALLAKVWVGHGKEIILMAFAASFMQQQVWQTVQQIGESTRQTARVQSLSLVIAILHLALITLFLYLNILSIRILFLLLIVEYLLAAFVAYIYFNTSNKSESCQVADVASIDQIFADFWHYCKPLIILSVFGFATEFADRWMLQRFGGAGQQGFYQISYQFAAVSLIATTSILNVFWKEIAEANGRGDAERVALLYKKVNRGLVMMGAVLSGFLIPWTKEIVTVFLGSAYLSAVPVLMLMFLYPIHQSMGQIGGTMLLASGKTRAYMIISVLVMLLSIPVSYMMQAPPDFKPISGFGMGAIGMGFKMVFVNILSVNIQAFAISKLFCWKYDWIYQVIGIGSVIAIGFISKIPADLFFELNQISSKFELIAPLSITLICYVILVGSLIWLMPWLAGFDRDIINKTLQKMNIQ